MPTPEREQRIEELLCELDAMTEPARATRCAEVCAAEPELADELRERLQLLGALQRMGEAESRSASPGPVFGAFSIERELGSGGMGVVYLARQRKAGVDRTVALKVIRHGGLLGEAARERFRREATAAMRVDHPALCPVYDVGEVDGTPYLAMRHVQGESLAQKIDACRRQQTPLLLAESDTAGDSETEARSTVRVRMMRIAALVEKLAQALHAAHEAGLVHRDVKPGNVMVTPEGEPVLLDFGLVQDDDEASARLTLTGQPLGTPTYMSPEQVRGRPVDRTTDVYSLGATLYECLTLRPPFAAPRRELLYQQILTSDPRAARSIDPAIPRELAVIATVAMAKEPGRRYATALAMAEDLRRARTLQPIEARPPAALVRGWLWCRRNPWVAGFVLLLVVAQAVVAWQARQTADSRDRALLNLEDARAAVAELSRTAQQDLPDVPRMQAVRQRLLERALAFHERFLARNAGVADLAEDVVRALSAQGALLRQLGRAAEAVPVLRRARANLAALPDADAELSAELSAELGISLGRLGENDAAESSLRAAIVEYERIAGADTARASVWQALARQLQHRGQSAAATEAYRTAVGLLRTQGARGDEDHARVLGATLTQLGGLLRDLYDHDEAERVFSEAIGLLEALSHPEPQRVLVNALVGRGSSRAITATNGARADLTRAIEIGRALYQAFPDALAYQQVLAGALAAASPAVQRAGDRDGAVALDAEALALREKMAEAHPEDLEMQIAHVVALFNAALGLQDDDQHAMPLQRRAVERCRELLDRHPEHVKTRQILSVASNSLSVHLWNLGEREPAMDVLNESHVQAERLVRDNPELRVNQQSLAHRRTMLGSRYLELGQDDEALRWLQRGLELRRSLAAEYPEVAQLGIDVLNGFSRYVRPPATPHAVQRLSELMDWLEGLPPEQRARYEGFGEFAAFRSWLFGKLVPRALAQLDDAATAALRARVLACNPDDDGVRALFGQ